MKAWLSTLALTAALALAGVAGAADGPPPSYPNQMDGDVVVRDFALTNGEHLANARFHYTTLGTPQRDASGAITNGVLLLHGTTGTGRNFLNASLGGELFGPGQPLDATKYFIILADGIGHGASSKPSDGLKGHFPHYGYVDAVEGQYRIVTQGLGIKRLKLVAGTSMGGMQTWIWGERHPDMMDALMPIASQPVAISGRNMLWRQLIIEAIRNDPDWKGGDYTVQPTGYARALPIFQIMVNNASVLQQQAPSRAAATALYDQWVADYAKTVDANDYLYWFESSYDYDPGPDLEKIKAKLVAVNFADDLLNPAELGVMEAAMKRIPQGRYVLIPASDQTRGHQTLTQAKVWKGALEEVLK
ncbi:homoserine O-acetyltransferase [Nitrospirillum amazonense]|uniref:Homoserine O-acetyltransferase n=1 Tax=Nitrospirillum amazonense TaxID=28077 RepID=A0A560EQ98_9PROT|nr:alpha/beta fold hydrolase [Nitrospirillum amazonense]TWB11562.1 homoserine O-acetyltransferase [Nitrospirillum amazonense]